jgi:hypothetical protein
MYHNIGMKHPVSTHPDKGRTRKTAIRIGDCQLTSTCPPSDGAHRRVKSNRACRRIDLLMRDVADRGGRVDTTTRPLSPSFERISLFSDPAGDSDD